MYLSQSDIVKLQLTNAKSMTRSDALRELLKSDEESDDKKAMSEGTKYYKLQHDILNRDFRVFYIDKAKHINKNAANNKIVHAYHKILVDQKVSYIAGNPIIFTHENEQQKEILSPYFKQIFHKSARAWLKGSSNRGIEYLHPYINRKGAFDYVIINGSEIIPIYDSRFQKELTGVVRYYKVEYKERLSDFTKYRYKVEIWDKRQVLFLEEDETGKFVLERDKPQNPRPHFYAYNTVNPQIKEKKSWGKAPFIPLKNNEEAMTDLQLVKTLIDNYDYNVSDFSNKLQNIAKAIWVLKDYKGNSLSEFVYNLNAFSAMKVGATGGVDRMTIDIPKEAHDSHLDRIEDNIFVFGLGVNPKIDQFGNSPSGIALKYLYAGLDLKSNMQIIEAQTAFQEYAWFAAEYEKIQNNKVVKVEDSNFVFDKSLLINEKEITEMVTSTAGIVDKETILENIPWVKDSSIVLERLKKEKEENGVDLDKIPNEK